MVWPMEQNNCIWEERGLREAILRGDAAAWRTLYHRCFDGIYGFVYFRAQKDHQRAEDVVQEAWMIGVKKIKSFDPTRSSFESWLRGIAKNVLKNKQRAWKRKKDREEIRDLDQLSQEAPAPEPLIAQALTSLSSRYQLVLEAKYQENLSVAAIAEKWGESPKAVESLLFRARQAFQDKYRRQKDGQG